MFFRRRSTQAEYFDLPGRSESKIFAGFQDLDRLNDKYLFERPFEELLPRWLGSKRCERLEILDVGAGTGLLGRKLSAWAQQRNWDWRFTNADINPSALKLGACSRAVIGSVLALPFADASFDLVVASQMTHHLNDLQIIQHWREARRVTRDAVFVCDLHRNAGLYAMIWLSTRFIPVCKPIRDDALISVKRSFRLREWRVLAALAGLADAKVRIYYGARIVLLARREISSAAVAPATSATSAIRPCMVESCSIGADK